MSRVPVLILLLAACALVAACAPAAPQPDRPPEGGATPTPLPTPAGWVSPSEVVSLRTAARLRELGSLAVPEPPSTVFAHALPLDNSRLYGVNNTHLLGWDLQTGETLFAAPREEALDVFVSPDRLRLYTLTVSGFIRVYDATSGESVEAFRSLANPSGAVAYDRFTGLLAVGGRDGQIQVWDMPNRTALAQFGGVSSPIAALGFTQDGQALLGADQNGSLTLWDIASREVIASVDLLTPVYAVLPTEDGTRILADTFDGTLRLTLPDLSVDARLSPEGSGSVFSLLPSGAVLLGNGLSDLAVWDIASGQLVGTLPQTTGERVSAALSPDGSLAFVSVLGQGATIWNVSNVLDGMVLRGTLRIDDAQFREVVWTDDGYQVLFFTTRGPVRVWGVTP
ncbi:MAG: hypothetical protein MUC99_00545 [Anaerolineae bacterium]|nr:hypothetical protein [Anaerolineae bacterium]